MTYNSVKVTIDEEFFRDGDSAKSESPQITLDTIKIFEGVVGPGGLPSIRHRGNECAVIVSMINKSFYYIQTRAENVQVTISEGAESEPVSVWEHGIGVHPYFDEVDATLETIEHFTETIHEETEFILGINRTKFEGQDAKVRTWMKVTPFKS